MCQKHSKLLLKTLLTIASFISLNLPLSYAMESKEKRHELEKKKQARAADWFIEAVSKENPLYFGEFGSTFSVAELLARPIAHSKEKIKKKILDEDTLDLKDIKSIPSEIGRLTNLKTIFIYSQDLCQFPKEIGKLVKLERIWLNTPNLDTILGSVEFLINLKSIDINSNTIQELPAGFGNLVNLEECRLNTGNLNKLPEEIGGLQSLKTFSLRSSAIQVLPTGIGNLINLQRLELHTKNLNDLPEEMKGLQNLQTLIISSDVIKELSADIMPSKLTGLSLRRCSHLEKIAFLEENIELLNTGLTIDLHNTPLRSLFGKDTITPQYVITHRDHIRNLQIGGFVNMVFALQSQEYPQALNESNLGMFPKELRARILEFMAAKSAQEVPQ